MLVMWQLLKFPLFIGSCNREPPLKTDPEPNDYNSPTVATKTTNSSDRKIGREWSSFLFKLAPKQQHVPRLCTFCCWAAATAVHQQPVVAFAWLWFRDQQPVVAVAVCDGWGAHIWDADHLWYSVVIGNDRLGADTEQWVLMWYRARQYANNVSLKRSGQDC